ncbi:MAG: SseB family protein [Trebonia sp.]
MLPIDPGDGPGSPTPAQPLRDIVPLQAMAHGGTIIRPGAVAWGGTPDARDGGYASCEAIERALAAVAANPGELPGLLAELATTRLWVPLPATRRPFTDGAAVLLPLVSSQGTDFVPCFTSVQRLAGWSDLDPGRESSRQRSGDARVVPHIVVPALGLAQRLPAGLGLAINPDSVPGVPLYPGCVAYLAGLVPRPDDGSP